MIMVKYQEFGRRLMRADLSLPDGYRVREIQGYLYLFDPRGVPLVGPTDAGSIEAYAWRDAWRQIDRELNEELAELRAGARPLHRLPRLRQYMRMMDAVTKAQTSPDDVREDVAARPVRARLFLGPMGWKAVAASAAAIAIVFLVASLKIGGPPAVPSHVATMARPAAVLLAKRPAMAAPVEPGASAPVQAVSPVQRETARVAHAGPRRLSAVAYVVSFGEFTRDASADSMMHFIRSKGYIVNVSPVGDESRVVTPPFRSRAQAAHLVDALQEIGLPAQLAPAHIL
jgi:cell division septation protein DedD